MDYKLLPLTMNQTNWPAYIELYSELFDVSPTRVLDDKNIKLDKPHALEVSLTKHFGNITKKLINLAFIGTANADMLINISNCSTTNMVAKESSEERGLYVFVINANLDEWKAATTNLIASKNKNTRNLGEHFVTLIKMAGYTL